MGILLLLLTGCAGMNTPPLGLTDEGKLTPCPSSPNCVSSDATDEGHAIAPLILKVEPEQAWATLLAHLEGQPRFTVTANETDYLRVQARTRLLRFTDDVEFHLRTASNEIAMRSASRVGYSDLGANRKRLEGIRTALAEADVVESDE